MLSPKDYLISKQFYKKKLLILTGFIIKNIKNKSLKCHVVWNQEMHNFKVKEVNLVDTVQATWEVIQISNMVLKINRWCKRKMNKIKWKWKIKNNKKLKIYNNNNKWTINQTLLNNKNNKNNKKQNQKNHLLMILPQLKTMNNLKPPKRKKKGNELISDIINLINIE